MRTRRDSPLSRRRPVGVLVGMFAACLVLVQCAPVADAPAPTKPVNNDETTRPSAQAPTQFTATVHPVTAEELGPSWHPGCPVEPGQLRRVEVSHIGFDGQTHVGDLVVNQDRVPQVISVFEQLYRIRYPIEKMRTVDHYPGAQDELSMRDNNTSAFNCRDIPGRGKWSYHAYGRAVDVNPLINPFIDDTGSIQPSTAAKYVDRARSDPGMLHESDPAVRAFTDRGWQWGGRWTSPIDYQHFELP